ncbi:hypothetical protein ACJX0J_028354, partial [Zea mays]
MKHNIGTQVQLPSAISLFQQTLQDMFGACDFTTNAYHHVFYTVNVLTLFS